MKRKITSLFGKAYNKLLRSEHPLKKRAFTCENGNLITNATISSAQEIVLFQRDISVDKTHVTARDTDNGITNNPTVRMSLLSSDLAGARYILRMRDIGLPQNAQRGSLILLCNFAISASESR